MCGASAPHPGSIPPHLDHLPPDGVRFASSQQQPGDCTSAAEIDDAAVALAQHRHHLPQILYRRCPSLVDRSLCCRFDLILVELMRQETLDDSYLLALLLRKIGAVALLIKRSIRGAA